jgi:hypothetical protein
MMEKVIKGLAAHSRNSHCMNQQPIKTISNVSFSSLGDLFDPTMPACPVWGFLSFLF